MARGKKMQRDDYLTLRHLYEPVAIKLVIVAESPPASGKYFYNPKGTLGEPLFAALMRQLRITPGTKHEGLAMFQRRGWVLIDATYQPVNELSNASRNDVIAKDYPKLRRDLENLIANRSTPIILVKANVCRLLEPKLTQDRFNVLNRGSVVSFPSNGRQNEFHRQFRTILRASGN